MGYTLSVKVVSFDCYGTLVDWILGLGRVLEYIFKDSKIINEFFKCEWLKVAKMTKYRPYSEVLKECLKHLMISRGLKYSEDLGDALVISFAKSPPYPDVIPTLKAIKRLGLRTIILSNTERRLIRITIAGMENLIDHVLTAEDIGLYKPSKDVFLRMLSELNVSPEQVLHISAYPQYDLIPAKSVSMKTLMVRRFKYSWSPSVEDLTMLVNYVK